MFEIDVGGIGDDELRPLKLILLTYTDWLELSFQTSFEYATIVRGLVPELLEYEIVSF
jgi:hypothetical protein